jgi:hypothetical protein
MTTDKNIASAGQGISRRSVLKGAVAIGAAAASGG